MSYESNSDNLIRIKYNLSLLALHVDNARGIIYK